MDKQSLVFCVAAIGISLMISFFAYPYAAISSKQLETSRIPMSAEQFIDQDLGDFGMVSVLDMVTHYVDNPPATPVGAAPKVRFQGC